MDLVHYLSELRNKEHGLGETLKAIAVRHASEPNVSGMCKLLAAWSEAHFTILEGMLGVAPTCAPAAQAPDQGLGCSPLMHDLQDAWLAVADVHVRWAVVHQMATARHHTTLLRASLAALGHSQRQMAWLLARLKEAAPVDLKHAA